MPCTDLGNKTGELQLQVATEIQLHSCAVHPHILALYAAFEDLESIRLVFEYAPCGNLYQFVAAQGGHLTETQVTHHILRPLLLALAYLHSMVRSHILLLWP